MEEPTASCAVSFLSVIAVHQHRRRWLGCRIHLQRAGGRISNQAADCNSRLKKKREKTRNVARHGTLDMSLTLKREREREACAFFNGRCVGSLPRKKEREKATPIYRKIGHRLQRGRTKKTSVETSSFLSTPFQRDRGLFHFLL